MTIRPRHHQEGSALVMTLLTAVIIGMTLASYLTLVSSQNVSTMRSLAWNGTIPVVEAGIEEALTQLYYTGLTNLSANGWAGRADNTYHKSRDFGGGSRYHVLIKPFKIGKKEVPVIECTGYAPAPLAPSSQFGMILGLSPSFGSSEPSVPSVMRTVRVVASRRTPFDFAPVGSDSGIEMNGNNITTDSFDSTDPMQSTDGRYDPDKAGDKGDVATNSGLLSSLRVGNADIKGRVATGPNGSPDVGPSGSVGSKTWVESGNSGIEPGYFSDDANIDMPDVKLPFTESPSTPGGRVVDQTGYDYVLDTGNYQLSSFSGKVLVTGNATLLVTDLVKFTGNDYIEIAPGASLKLYVAAPSAEISGNGVVNGTGKAINFQYYGLPSNTEVKFRGNFSYTGVIYAPDANFSLGGGGNNTYDFVGAVMAKTIKFNGHVHIHADLGIRPDFPIALYVVESWNEI
jgi:hypothetical protein